VTPAGKGGLPPSRVWSGGSGLAMSRSLGDYKHRDIGCIPDPEIEQVTLSAVTSANGDGDLFIIVASDGVWEFIESDEACGLVSEYDDASKACTRLVQEAQQRWAENEGSYRDDITAIVVLLPFTYDADDDENNAESKADDSGANAEEDGLMTINKGTKGVQKLLPTLTETSEKDKPDPAAAAAAATPAAEGGDDEAAEFQARRLSTTAPIDVDDDWYKEDDGDD